MKLVIGKTFDGVDIFLCDDHSEKCPHMIPVVTIGTDSKSLDRADYLKTNKGLVEVRAFVLEWMLGGENTHDERALAFRFLHDDPEDRVKATGSFLYT